MKSGPFHRLIRKEWPLKPGQAPMICHLIQIKNAINFDVHFLDSPDVDAFYSSAIRQPYRYVEVDPKTLQGGPEKTALVYRVRLAGIISRDSPSLKPQSSSSQRVRARRDRDRKNRFGLASFQLVRWNNLTGGIFACIPSGIDMYGRVLVDLIDLGTGISVREYLLEMFEDIYQQYEPWAE